MDNLNLINNTSVYRNPAPQSPLQGPGVMQPAAVYSKIMLRTIELEEKDYVFDSLAVERNMPSNNGANEIVFKRMLSLAAHTQPLVEGIPPASDQGRMVAIKGSTKSYGRVMKFTDKVNWAVVDPLISEYTRQLALKVPETKDILAQEALLSECQVFYASEKERESGNDSDILVPVAGGGLISHITHMTPDCAPTIDEFRKIVLSMEAAKVRPYQGENFLVLLSPAVMFDLITDKRVKEFMKYANTGVAYKNDMIIDLFSLAFKKAKTIKSDNTFVDYNGVLNYIYHCPTAHITTSEISSVTYDGPINMLTTMPIGEMDSGTIKVIRLEGGDYTAKDMDYSKLATVTKGAYDKLNIHHSLVIGEDCLYRIGVEGHTQPQFIKKELGSSGTEDPLNQRQSIGWKIDSLGYKVINPDAVVDYMSCPTQYKINMNARPDLKNQFTDYNYGYVDETGRYWYPEQVTETLNSLGNGVIYYVKGTTIKVEPVKMTKLVKPIATGHIQANGQNPVVVGTVPTTFYALKSNKEVRFGKEQVIKHSDGNFYIKGLAGISTAQVVALPVTFSKDLPTADGSEIKSTTVVDDGTDVNITGDPTIDDLK